MTATDRVDPPGVPTRDLRPWRETRTTRTLTAMDTGQAGTEPRGRRRPLLLQDFVDVPCPLEAVRGRFTGDGDWLAPLANAAEEDGEALRLRIGPSWAAVRVTREVRVTLGPPHDWGDALVLPLAWEASGLRALFPLLEGDIELAPLGTDRFRLTLSASYVPPFGELGARLDRALMHRVAVSTVRSFLVRVAASLGGDGDGPTAPTALGRPGEAPVNRPG